MGCVDTATAGEVADEDRIAKWRSAISEGGKTLRSAPYVTAGPSLPHRDQRLDFH